jgi:anti-sigma B factor antagonist
MVYWRYGRLELPEQSDEELTLDADPAPALSLSTRITGDIAIAELTGELDMPSSPDLRDQLLDVLQRGSSRLVIDLSGVTDADASGLAVLVGTGRRARLLGGSLRLAAVPPQVDQVLHDTGLHRHLDVAPTVQAAVSSLQGDARGLGRDGAARAARAAGALPPSYSQAIAATATGLRRVLNAGYRPVLSVR